MYNRPKHIKFGFCWATFNRTGDISKMGAKQLIDPIFNKIRKNNYRYVNFPNLQYNIPYNF